MADFLGMPFVDSSNQAHFVEVELFWRLLVLRLALRLPQEGFDGLEVGVLCGLELEEAEADLRAHLQSDAQSCLLVKTEVAPASLLYFFKDFPEVGEVEADKVGHFGVDVVLEVVGLQVILLVLQVSNHFKLESFFSLLVEDEEQVGWALLADAKDIIFEFLNHRSLLDLLDE
jgi:hypothetical protein